MLLYDIIAEYSSLGKKYKMGEYEEGYNRLINCPHYYVTALRLKSIFEQVKIDRKKLNFKDINLPHQSLILTIKDDDIDTVDEVVLNIKDMSTYIKVTAFFKFEMSKVKDNIFIIARIDPVENGDSGIKFSIEETNLKEFFIKGKVETVEDKLSQYMCNKISQFSLAINKSKDLREGEEKRFVKINKKAKGKKGYQNVTIIHLESFKYLQKNKSNLKSTIVWNNSWIVRGHWRYFSDQTRLGKDRNEIRQEEGRTWIMPYQKQKELELKNNIREMRD